MRDGDGKTRELGLQGRERCFYGHDPAANMHKHDPFGPDSLLLQHGQRPVNGHVSIFAFARYVSLVGGGANEEHIQGAQVSRSAAQRVVVRQPSDGPFFISNAKTIRLGVF